jgi:Tfp pilus assembly protein PilF
MLARTGRALEAEKVFSAVLKPAQVHYNLASVYEHMGRTDQARAEYEKALKEDPAYSDARDRLGKLKP